MELESRALKIYIALTRQIETLFGVSYTQSLLFFQIITDSYLCDTADTCARNS